MFDFDDPDWEPTNNERHLVAINGITFNIPNHPLPAEIDNYRLWEYAILSHCKVRSHLVILII